MSPFVLPFLPGDSLQDYVFALPLPSGFTNGTVNLAEPVMFIDSFFSLTSFFRFSLRFTFRYHSSLILDSFSLVTTKSFPSSSPLQYSPPPLPPLRLEVYRCLVSPPLIFDTIVFQCNLDSFPPFSSDMDETFSSLLASPRMRTGPWTSPFSPTFNLARLFLTLRHPFSLHDLCALPTIKPLFLPPSSLIGPRVFPLFFFPLSMTRSVALSPPSALFLAPSPDLFSESARVRRRATAPVPLLSDPARCPFLFCQVRLFPDTSPSVGASRPEPASFCCPRRIVVRQPAPRCSRSVTFARMADPLTLLLPSFSLSPPP